MNKLNKTLIAILLVLCVGLVGITIAYFSNSTEIENEFITKEYGTTYIEEFVSPSNWLPGDTTDKTVTVTNSGEVDEAVRISLSETWTPNDSNATLTGWIHADGTKSNHTTEEELATDVRAALINFTENSDWTKVGDYYYYNYKLAPGETTDSLIESVTFNALTKLGDTCTPTTSNGVTTITCNSSGSDYDHATYTLTLTIETVQYNKYQEAWGTNVVILEEKPQPTPAGAQYLATTATNEANAEYNASTKGKMFQFTHTVNNQTVNESRYIGNDPNNYVYFNCTDDTDTSTCEVWRILGTFDVERTDPEDATKTITETRMKLVRGSVFASTMQWDNRVCETCSGNTWGKNDWNGSYMNTYLNETYYSSLSATAQSQIDDAIYYLGGWNWNGSDTTYTTEKIYEMERGTENCVTTGNCSGGTRSTSWEGKVALMYPSDMYMTYAKTDGVGCYNQPMNSSVCGSTNGAKSWVYNTNKLENGSSYQLTWFLSPLSSSPISVFRGNSTFLDFNDAFRTFGVRPVVYLKADIKIDTGTGEVGNPYKLGL